MTTLRGSKRRPTHPGEILREDVLPSLDITQFRRVRLRTAGLTQAPSRDLSVNGAAALALFKFQDE